MGADIKLKDYYLSFISNAKRDILIYSQELEYYTKVRDKLLDYINENIDKYKEHYNLIFNDYDKAIERARTLIQYETDSTKRYLLFQLVKLGSTLRHIEEYNYMIYHATKRKSIKFRQYEKYVIDYYDKVHKYILQGFGYTYNFGIGTICICRWKSRTKRLILDYNATNLKKKELIALGKKLYNEQEAKWSAARHIPYNGIDYRVYKRDSHVYKFHIIRSKLFNSRNHTFEHTEYINNKFKGLGFKDMADICKDLDEICAMPVDIRYKLNMVLYKDPASYILYIRNNEQDRYEYGAHNCQD